jgi:hypothetical protein
MVRSARTWLSTAVQPGHPPRHQQLQLRLARRQRQRLRQPRPSRQALPQGQVQPRGLVLHRDRALLRRASARPGAFTGENSGHVSLREDEGKNEYPIKIGKTADMPDDSIGQFKKQTNQQP